MAAIFVSHSSRDNDLAKQMKTWLAGQGYEQVFMDFDKHTGIQLGEHWERRLYDEIARCHAVILILTPNWLDSKWCFVEFTYARALGKIIFPIVLTPLGDKQIAPEIQGVDLKDWDTSGKEYLRRRIREVSDEVARGFQWDRSRSPYPGIYSFEAQDAAVFFGRDVESREIIEKLESRRVTGGKPLLLILGASGSGKSSLLKAGVLPQLARDQSHWLLLTPFRPERAPVSALAKSVAEKLGRAENWREWQQHFMGPDAVNTLKNIANDLRLGPAREATVLISIDQFEEAFATANEPERTKFFDLLHIATSSQYGLPFQIVGTMRSDIFNELLQFQKFAMPFTDYVLRPIPLGRVARLIEGPAEVAAITLEKGLSRRIADDVKSPDALPLLAFALREFYERFGQERRLSIIDYDRLGDANSSLSPIETAVHRKADEILGALQPNPAELDALKEAFVAHLVRVREDGAFVRQPANLAELPPSARRLISAYVDARLMSTRVESTKDGSATIIEVAHEALFNAWPLLTKWLDAERQFLVGKVQLDRFLAEWNTTRGGEKQNALLQGLYLARAREWRKNHRSRLSKEEIIFIEASERRARQRTWLLSGLAAAVVVLIASVTLPRVYAEYIQRTALECDLYAAEPDNNVHVPGVEFDRIISDVAIPACDRAAKADPTNPRLLHNLGRSYDKAGKFQDAAQYYAKAGQLSWPASENALGVFTIYGRGVPPDFERGVDLVRAASEQGNADAMRNYTGTDFTTLFSDDDIFAGILESTLVGKGFLSADKIKGKWSPELLSAIESFKMAERISDVGITLRVLDRLGVVAQLSAVMKQRQTEKQ
jgi:hypothetical protein